MAHHQAFSKATGIQVYFAHSHSPREQGINKNPNGLLRRTLGHDHQPCCTCGLNVPSHGLVSIKPALAI